jgi:hypothetical protein
LQFDDRLLTVLGQSADAPRDRVVQWRQLVELIARGAGGIDTALRERALARIAEISPEVPETVRATAARAIAAPGLPVALLRLFVADRAEVAAPLLGAAELAPSDWEILRAAASDEVKDLIDTLQPPGPAGQVAVRDPAQISADLPRSNTDLARLFHWECGPDGDIDWVDGAARAAVIGRSVRATLPARFDTMQPFLDEPLLLADGLGDSGEWRWSGQPQFTSAGRFAGYSGIARRIAANTTPRHDPVPSLAVSLPADHGNLRELIHELRTPLTAIIGFGEVIEGQYLGPAHRGYRDRAGEIVRQARLLLAAVEDLDLAAKLRSGGATPSQSTVINDLAGQLDDRIKVQLRASEVRCALEPGLTQRLLRRFVGALADAAELNEPLQLVIERDGEQAVLALDRPAATLGLSDEDLLRRGSAGNIGFALRLVRGLAGIAGGSLVVEPSNIVLRLPAV